MKIGILKETAAGERRVALVPETVKRLSQKKFEILVQTGAGEAASFSDAEYLEAGAVAVSEAEAVAQSDIICRINKPSSADAGRMHSGTVHISLLYPLLNPDLVKVLASSGVTAVSLDSIPRTTLAQMMDVLSSQATVAGYWAVLAAANRLPKFFPMLMTAAGTVSPAKVLVLGAGVAGLQAIGTARRLGAVVEAFDVRKASKTEVESLGAKFVTVSEEDLAGEGGYAREASQEYKKRQADLIGRRLAKADVAITTALIPGRQAPILITEDMARAMRPGSVIVDLAAEQGGNCELTAARSPSPARKS